MNKIPLVDTQRLWLEFQKRQKLTDHQLEQFKIYYQLLVETNDIHNLTAITNLGEIIKYHFEDSLALNEAHDLLQLKSIADVGSGGGFPGIPLKIKYPHLSLLLIEVNHKKVQFLLNVFDTLKLDQCDIFDLDWRTFIRKTTYKIDLFCARASLQPEELLRIFKPSSPYKDAKLVYWASAFYQPEKKETPYVLTDVHYRIGQKDRRLVTFALPKGDV